MAHRPFGRRRSCSVHSYSMAGESGTIEKKNRCQELDFGIIRGILSSFACRGGVMAAALDSKSSVRIGRGGSTPPLGTRWIIANSVRYSNICDLTFSRDHPTLRDFGRPASLPQPQTPPRTMTLYSAVR